MTAEFDALVEKVARAIREAPMRATQSGGAIDSTIPLTDNELLRARAALRVVAEAMREPPARIKTATGFGIPTTTADEHWRALVAAHPISEALRDE